MFGFFQNNTPHYAGEGQPNPYNGNKAGLGLFGDLFGFSSTPKYATARSDKGQATATVIAPATTEAIASEQLPAQPDCRVPLPCAIVIQRSEQ